MFVKPKLILGGLIIGVGITACQSNNKNHSLENSNSERTSDTICSAKGNSKMNEDKSSQASVEKTKNDKVISETTCYFQVPVRNTEDTALKQQTDIINERSISDSTIFIIAEKMPQFSDGDIVAYLAKNIRQYPIYQCYNGIQGRVICQFVVETDGSITNLHVVRGVDPSLDKDAVRVISSMPKWIPGENQGVKVRVRYTLPVNFKLQ